MFSKRAKVLTLNANYKQMSKYARDRMQYKNKPRKILSLEERVQALRMFDQTPVYQRVATAFGCSWEQIKNVVLSREEILTYYARCQTIMPNEHPNQVRKKKIIFLGNVVFEYIRRAFYHNSARLDEEAIRERALEFRDAIEIDQFYPNSAWLNDFKRVFNIELPNPENIVVTQKPPESLDCNDIIAYCRNEVGQLLVEKNKKKLICNDNGVSSTSIHTSGQSELIYNDEENDNDNYDDDVDGDGDGDGDVDDEIAAEEEEGLTIDFSHYDYNDTTVLNSQPKATPPAIKRSPYLVDSSTMRLKRIKQERRSNSPPATTETAMATDSTPQKTIDTKNPTMDSYEPSHLMSITPPQILSSKSALAYLIPLQDYALGEEDFIAINLLSRLVEHYQCDIKHETN